jgi:hypothetical protein
MMGPRTPGGPQSLRKSADWQPAKPGQMPHRKIGQKIGQLPRLGTIFHLSSNI